jgi:hypothetical protein
MTFTDDLSRNRTAPRGPRALALLLTALLLASPALPAVAAGPASAGPVSLWHWLDVWMARAFAADGTDAGGDMDPTGLLALPAASGADPGMDPNGYTTTGTGTDAGPDMDPDGLTTTTTGDAGGSMDPNG